MDKYFQPRSATLNDVGALSGVSYQTVSRVVNESPLVAEKTRARIEAMTPNSVTGLIQGRRRRPELKSDQDGGNQSPTMVPREFMLTLKKYRLNDSY